MRKWSPRNTQLLNLFVLKWGMLCALQVGVALLLIKRRTHLILAVSLLGMFGLLSWGVFPPLPRLEETLNTLIGASALTVAGYFLSIRFLGRESRPIEQNFSLKLAPVTLATLLFFLQLPLWTVVKNSSWIVPVFALQKFFLIFIFVNKGRFRYWGMAGAGILVIVFFLRFSSVQYGINLALVLILVALFNREYRFVVYLGLLSVCLVFLQSQKTMYRKRIEKREQVGASIAWSERARIFFNFKSSFVREMGGSALQRMRKLQKCRFSLSYRSTLGALVQESLKKGTRPGPGFVNFPFVATVEAERSGWEYLGSFGIEPKYRAAVGDLIPIFLMPISPAPVFAKTTFWEDSLSSRLEYVFHLMRRFGDDSLERVLSYTPERVPYWRGVTYSRLKYLLVPRIFWKDKPNWEVWNTFGRQYGYLQYEDRDTSVSFHYLSEAYMNFGKKAMYIAALVMGLMLASLQSVGTFISPTWRFLFYISIISAIALPTDAYSLLSEVLNSLVVFFFLWTMSQFATTLISLSNKSMECVLQFLSACLKGGFYAKRK